MTTTNISITAVPQTSQIPTVSSRGHRAYQHALLIDLGAFDDHPYGHEPPDQLSDAEKDATYPLFIQRLEQIVKSSGRDNPPIDMVRFMSTNARESPSERTWEALDGLQPLHLELHCGNLEEGWMEPLDQLKVAWPLETLQISGLAGGGPWPKACRSIVSLVLDACCGVNFTPPGGCDSLRHLSILENDAIDMFTVLCVKNPLIAKTLETVELQTSCVLSDYRPVLFKEMLRQCVSLRSLKLVFGAKESFWGPEKDWEGELEGSMADFPQHRDVSLGDQSDDDMEGSESSGPGLNDASEFDIEDVDMNKEEYEYPQYEKVPGYKDLPLFLPNEIEDLHIKGPLEMVDHLAPWLESVTNWTWLPALKTFSFQVAVLAEGVHAAKPSPEIAPGVSDKVQQFLDHLSATRPSLRLIDH